MFTHSQNSDAGIVTVRMKIQMFQVGCDQWISRRLPLAPDEEEQRELGERMGRRFSCSFHGKGKTEQDK
jgi:hypothetical protein